MATFETAWRKEHGPVKYYASNVPVNLGDIVELRVWFKWRRARINYVPGISKPHSEMEHNALFWIGIVREDGRFVADIVDPDTGCTRKIVRFLSRGTMDELPSVPEEPWE